MNTTTEPMTVSEAYEIICRIEADGGNPDDEETWERYAHEFRPYTESDTDDKMNCNCDCHAGADSDALVCSECYGNHAESDEPDSPASIN